MCLIKAKKEKTGPGEHCTWTRILLSPNKKPEPLLCPSSLKSLFHTHSQQPLNGLSEAALILSATIINKQINHVDGMCV